MAPVAANFDESQGPASELAWSERTHRPIRVLTVPRTLRQVYLGGKVIPRQVASKLAEHMGDEGLTPRELQVLQLVAQGNRNKQIAGLHAVTIALARGFFPLHSH